MAYVAVDKDGAEYIYEIQPERSSRSIWNCGGEKVLLSSGTIEKHIGRKLTWDDEPVDLD